MNTRVFAMVCIEALVTSSLMLLPRAAMGQAAPPVRIVDSRVACPACAIHLQLLAHVRDSETAPWLGESAVFTRDGANKLFGTSFWITPGVIHVVDSIGAVRTRFGREGSGPGEGRAVAPPVFAVGDTGYVYDFQQGRITVWSAEDPVRTIAVPGILNEWLVADEGIVVNANIRTRQHAGFPLHLLSRSDGSVLRSFGSHSPGFRFDLPALNSRSIAVARNGQIWAAHQTRYRIERWTTTGELTYQLERDAGWFPPWDGRRGDDRQEGSYVSAIWEDTNGLLWIVIETPDRNWREGLESLPDTPMGRSVSMATAHLVRDIVIEVIDPLSATLVTTRRFDRYLNTIGHGHPLSQYQERNGGLPSFLVYQPFLSGWQR